MAKRRSPTFNERLPLASILGLFGGLVGLAAAAILDISFVAAVGFSSVGFFLFGLIDQS